ncbi:hypothetical protein ACIA58_11330 [Kribbella sp. NPDC051586]|uniref:hypothetical protein n=1 Tax=Kribbella sp. NPDC051586 TaxID=3364118 RepID=UPI0037B6FE41
MQAETSSVEVDFHSFAKPGTDVAQLAYEVIHHTGWRIQIFGDQQAGPQARLSLPQDDLLANVSHLVALLALAGDVSPQTVLGEIRTKVSALGYDVKRQPSKWR